MFNRALILASRSLTPSNSRPHTPSSSGKSNLRNTRSPPRIASLGISSPSRKPKHSQPHLIPDNEWENEDDDEEDEEDEEVQYAYNEGQDEDEFGLPSLSSMRREAKKRIPTEKFVDPGGGLGSAKNGSSSMHGSGLPFTRPRANSSDIALERGPPSYPSAKTSEGKILRPQYKDILRGEISLANYRFILISRTRSSEFSSSDFTSINASQCYCERGRSSLDPHLPNKQIQTNITG